MHKTADWVNSCKFEPAHRDFIHSKCNVLIFVFQDNKLTKEEIVDKHDVFVGSQATDFGEALTRHDEF